MPRQPLASATHGKDSRARGRGRRAQRRGPRQPRPQFVAEQVPVRSDLSDESERAPRRIRHSADRSRTQARDLPVRAILTVSVVVSVLCLVGFSSNAFTLLVSFTTGGFFVAFSFAIFGYLYQKFHSSWQSAAFNLKGWGVAVAILAAAYTVLEYINIAWPRGGQSWFSAWGVLIMTAVAGASGALLYRSVRTQVAHWHTGIESESPAQAPTLAADPPGPVAAPAAE
jgi:cation transport ATPase